MNLFTTTGFGIQTVVELVGLTILLSAFPILLLSIVARALMTSMRSPQWRYVSGVCTLLVIAILVPSTFWMLYCEVNNPAAASQTDVLKNSNSSDCLIDDIRSEPQALNSTRESKSSTSLPDPGHADNNPLARAVENRPVVANEPSSTSNSNSPFALLKPIVPWMPVVVVFWLIGFLLLLIRLWIGWRFSARISKVGLIVDTKLVGAWNQIASKAGFARKVRVFASELVDVPVVVGLFRSMVLVPTSVITNLSDAELRSILRHELAHLIRYDAWINWFQTVLETVLFYHPSVWWISKQIRRDRELCCDQMAAENAGQASILARALLKLEELRSPQLSLLSATGGDLKKRIMSLLEMDRRSYVKNHRTGVVAMSLIGFLTISIAALATLGQTSGSVDESDDTSQEEPKLETAPDEEKARQEEKFDKLVLTNISGRTESEKVEVENQKLLLAILKLFPEAGQGKKGMKPAGYIADYQLEFFEAGKRKINIFLSTRLNLWSETDGDWKLSDLEAFEKLVAIALASGKKIVDDKNSKDEPIIAWGETNFAGFSTGISFLPSKESYQAGEVVQILFHYRNDSKRNKSLVLPRIVYPVLVKWELEDKEGNSVKAKLLDKEVQISGYMESTVAPGANAISEGPKIQMGGKMPNDDSEVKVFFPFEAGMEYKLVVGNGKLPLISEQTGKLKIKVDSIAKARNQKDDDKKPLSDEEIKEITASLEKSVGKLGDWYTRTTFRSAPYMKVARDLQRLPEKNRKAILRKWCKPYNDQVILLCKMLFDGKEKFRRPYVGAPVFIDAPKHKKWVREPIQLIDEVPFVIVQGYALGGRPEHSSKYLEYCLKDCKWSNRKFEHSNQATLTATFRKFIDANEHFDARAREFIANQIAIDVKDSNKRWELYGKVTDESGKPMEGVELRMATGFATLLGGGSTHTDKNGNYVLHFGEGIFSQGSNMQVAWLFVQEPGYVYQSNSRKVDLSMAMSRWVMNEHEMNRSAFRQLNSEDLIVRDRPHRMDIVMGKPAEIIVELRDENGNRIENSGLHVDDTNQTSEATSISYGAKENERPDLAIGLKTGRDWTLSIPIDKRRRQTSHPMNFKEPGQYVVNAVRSKNQGAHSLTINSIKKLDGTDVTEQILVHDGAAGKPFAEKDQLVMREMIKKIRQANAAWITPSEQAEKWDGLEFEIGNARQSVKYKNKKPAKMLPVHYSGLHHLMQRPEDAVFRSLKNNENGTFEIGFSFKENVRVSYGNGILGSWRGFVQTNCDKGVLTVDQETLTPIKFTSNRSVEEFLGFVKLENDSYAPRTIRITSPIRCEWQFEIYEGNRWLTQSLHNGKQQLLSVSKNGKKLKKLERQ